MVHSSNQLSRLMKMSWQIQKSKQKTRSQSLQAAWTIFQNEDVTIYYLTQKLNHHKPLPHRATGQFTIFST